jgi:hypothetical protein
MVLTNLVYLVPIIVIVLVRFKSWRSSGLPRLGDSVFIGANIAVGVVSALYHSCDDTSGHMPCHKMCVVPWDDLYNNDMVVSGFTAYALASVGWNPSSHTAGLCVVLSFVFFPYIALFLVHSPLLYLATVLCAVAVVLLVRFHHSELEFVQYSPTTILLMVAIAAILGTTALVMQYTSLPLAFLDSVPIRHSCWHVGTGLAESIVPLLFAQTSARGSTKKKHWLASIVVGCAMISTYCAFVSMFLPLV